MDKGKYIELKTLYKNQYDSLTEKLNNTYISRSAPCKVGDVILLTHAAGRVEKMVVQGFTIRNNEVVVDRFFAFKDGEVQKVMRYISAAHKEVKVLEEVYGGD